jgi:hypothetical protein
MIRVRLTGDVEQFFGAFPPQLEALIARACLRVAQDAAGELAESAMENLAKNPTGALARSFEAVLVEHQGTIAAAEAISRLPYAAIHDRGGTIVPRRARALAIPMPGVPRGLGPRDVPGLHRRGNALFKPRARKPMFVLKRSVRIVGTGYVGEALARLLPKIPDALSAEIQAAVDAAVKR